MHYLVIDIMFILQRRRESKAFFELMERCSSAVGHRSQWKTLKETRRSISNSMFRSISLNDDVAYIEPFAVCSPFHNCGDYFLCKILLCA